MRGDRGLDGGSARRLIRRLSSLRRAAAVPYRRRPTRVTSKSAAVRPDWGQRLTSLASLATVGVAIAALLHTSQANGEQVRLTEQGQVTDRFTRAVDQLGSDKQDVRLGGIYAWPGPP